MVLSGWVLTVTVGPAPTSTLLAELQGGHRAAHRAVVVELVVGPGSIGIDSGYPIGVGKGLVGAGEQDRVAAGQGVASGIGQAVDRATGDRQAGRAHQEHPGNPAGAVPANLGVVIGKGSGEVFHRSGGISIDGVGLDLHGLGIADGVDGVELQVTGLGQCQRHWAGAARARGGGLAAIGGVVDGGGSIGGEHHRGR
jgi:hypothetical protein